MKLGQKLPYSWVLGTCPTLDDLDAALQVADWRIVIRFLAALNQIVAPWRYASQQEDQKLCQLLLPLHVQDMVRNACTKRGIPGGFVFVRQSLLYMMKRAAICRHEGALAPLDGCARAKIAVACLMANELSAPAFPTRHDPLVKRALGGIFDIETATSDHQREIGRALIIFGGSEDMAAGAKRVEELARGVMALGVGRMQVSEIEAADSDQNPFFIPGDYFRDTSLPNDIITSVFETLSQTEDDLAGAVARRGRPDLDLVPFQSRPLCRVEHGYYCLDPGFLWDKVGKNLFWTLKDLGWIAKPKDAMGHHGIAIERYLKNLLRSTYRTRGTLLLEPVLGRSKDFDLCILEGSTFVVAEIKSSVIEANAKYGGDPSALEAELDKKFVRGDNEGPKGIAQLVNGIGKLLRGVEIACEETANRVRRDQVTTIIPLMVTTEPALRHHDLVEHLQGSFKDKCWYKKPRILPLTVIDIGQFEEICAFLHAKRLSEIIEAINQESRRRHHRRRPVANFVVDVGDLDILRDVDPAKIPAIVQEEECVSRLPGALFP